MSIDPNSNLFSALQDNLILNVFCYFSPKQLCTQISLVDKRIYALSTSASLWKSHYLKHFSSPSQGNFNWREHYLEWIRVHQLSLSVENSDFEFPSTQVGTKIQTLTNTGPLKDVIWIIRKEKESTIVFPGKWYLFKKISLYSEEKGIDLPSLLKNYYRKELRADSSSIYQIKYVVYNESAYQQACLKILKLFKDIDLFYNNISN